MVMIVALVGIISDGDGDSGWVSFLMVMIVALVGIISDGNNDSGVGGNHY